MKKLIALVVLLAWAAGATAQEVDVSKRLEGFDDYMSRVLADWNGPGIGVGIVVGDKLVFAKGYGYRDYAKKLPFTPATVVPIASNTKLFTAVAAGMVVEDGKLTWDRPVHDSVPSIRFHNEQLNNTVTLRDMLSHRTGITRHDGIWYKSDFTRKELFERLKYLEPQEPMRQSFLYNNLMFAGVGYLIELQSGKTWEQFVRERILQPLEMKSTGYTIAEMVKAPEHGVGFTERRDSFELYEIPYYEDIEGVAPCGAIVSNIDDLSRWLTALMNDGVYRGKQVLPKDVLKETLQPAIGMPNTAAEQRGYWELLNAAYGMGRWTASYRGHLIAYHGGDLPGFHSQVSYMPKEKVGVVVLVVGNHTAPLYNYVSYNVYERLLGLDQTPWAQRGLDIRLKAKAAGKEARARAGVDRVLNTKPSHALADYSGEYQNPAYGVMKIGLKDNQLLFDFHKIRLPLAHFHYDRFDTPDDEEDGQWSVNFRTNPQGDIDQAVMSLDEAEAVFTKKPERIAPSLMTQLAGEYETPTGTKLQVKYQEATGLSLVPPGAPPVPLTQVKALRFRTPQFADVVFEFVVEDGRVRALKRRDPSGELSFPKVPGKN
ncbi:MAG TPA: serine hydrolase [Vicinamibacterales bacterium]|nr:serine hydrolase [Vicinamibacterales bacterium]